jgi:hypothetical protein
MSPTHNSNARRIATLSVSLFTCAAALAACDDDPIQPVPAVEWAADVVGVGEYAAVEGIAAVSARQTSFDADIEIAGAGEGAAFTWQVAAGTCAEPGDRIGAANRYPDLEGEADGTAAAEANVTAALDEEEEYIVRVLDESGDEPVTVACGALEIDE